MEVKEHLGCLKYKAQKVTRMKGRNGLLSKTLVDTWKEYKSTFNIKKHVANASSRYSH